MAEYDVISTIEKETKKDTGGGYDLDKVEKQWQFVTEAARRDILSRPETRKALLPYTTIPVSEAMPRNFFTAVSRVDSRLARLEDWYKDLREYLDIPPIPDEKIGRDLRNCGLPYGDEEMVATRYRLARDVKILALEAEIADQAGGVRLDENGEVVLPSGIKMKLITENGEQRVDFLNPQLWEKRRQLKDRVYEIEVNGRQYILKERKTARHTDTKKTGHIKGRLSSEEIEVAQVFQEQACFTEGDIQVSWEKPIGYVIYPDGFSFAVFEREEKLIPPEEMIGQLEEEIIAHRPQYEAEYKQIINNIKIYYDTPEIIADMGGAADLGTLARKWHLPTIIPQLSFEDYAKVKAFRMWWKSINTLKETITKMGYENSDLDGYAFRIHTGDKLRLEIVGFDFEYFGKLEPNHINEKLQDVKRRHEEYDRKLINEFVWEDCANVTRIQKAAYYGILDNEQ